MNKLHLLLLFCSNIACQHAVPQGGLKQDVETYRSTMTREHKDPFTAISRKQFDEQLDALSAKTSEMGRARCLVELMRINAQVNDEHSIIWPASDEQLPLVFKHCDDGIVIAASDSLHSALLMHRLVAVEHTPIDVVMQQLRDLVKADNRAYADHFSCIYLREPVLLNGLGITSNQPTMRFTLLSPVGDTSVVHIRLVPKDEPIDWIRAAPISAMLANSQSRNYWYHVDPTSRTLYFNYRSCTEDLDEPFKRFNEGLFKAMEQLDPLKIVLDLRSNGGGNSNVLQPFIKKITGHRLDTKETFYVLIGPRVMSSSLMNAVTLKRTTNATFIGSSTGGNVNHFGEIKSFDLPALGCTVLYSTKYWENWKGHTGALHPDIEVPNTSEDLLSGRDRALLRAMGE